ncbi:phage tail sheath family protein [Chitinophaga silvisoli]|uniref:Phage tail sheath family protein n=1 Tax=Chitinophaga silvisoli TaxID=2291814 RepID=A0A3E1NWC1_9BACT|nr:phage tail sheath C-terminal domain-containing protein [Chitinophaga silvisoli]RFM32227.1 phage tail sheath family protein [Chitinophaga silvisoli]
MAEYKTPGVYIEEIPKLPPSIASVETAIPAFIGYTEKAQWKVAGDLTNKPWRIASMLEYELYFGGARPDAGIEVTVDATQGKVDIQGSINAELRSKYLMYYSLQMFFINGGGPCYITSVGGYADGDVILDADLQAGLAEVEKIDEVTLLLFPDAINLASAGNYYALYSQAIAQCVKLKDRFTVLDVYADPANAGNWRLDVDFLRNTLSGTTDDLKYAAVYFPRIYTRTDFTYNEADVKIISNGAGEIGATLTELKSNNNAYYNMARGAINDIQMLLPASAAVVGVYATVDNNRGVWKAPANVNIEYAVAPELLITQEEQESLNVDTTAGKSINVIRSFPGRGPAIIWGARTLAGNDNEWRYIPVRRFFNMVEESTKNAAQQFVFEPNDRNTWIRVRSMIENYLTQQWKAGALMGTTTREAFYVRIGLGETMTEQDIWEGRMIVEIGLAVVRPAEFIILRFMHKMLTEA